MLLKSETYFTLRLKASKSSCLSIMLLFYYVDGEDKGKYYYYYYY